jgi:hypothetical protein
MQQSRPMMGLYIQSMRHSIDRIRELEHLEAMRRAIRRKSADYQIKAYDRLEAMFRLI